LRTEHQMTGPAADRLRHPTGLVFPEDALGRRWTLLAAPGSFWKRTSRRGNLARQPDGLGHRAEANRARA